MDERGEPVYYLILGQIRTTGGGEAVEQHLVESMLGLACSGMQKGLEVALAMSGERFKKQEAGSFFGDFLYDQVGPPVHFLRQLNALVPWQRFSKKLVKL